MEKVAVILPVYKNDKVPYIKLSFDSILNQTYGNIHLYVGVDGPVGKDLKACLQEYEKDERISVEWFKENRGLAIVLNDLLDICFKAGYEVVRFSGTEIWHRPYKCANEVLNIILSKCKYIKEEK